MIHIFRKTIMIDIAKLFIVRYFFIEDIAISSEYLPLKLNSRFESQFFAYSTNTYGKIFSIELVCIMLAPMSFSCKECHISLILKV